LAQILNGHKRLNKENFDAEIIIKYIETSRDRLAKDQIGRNYSLRQMYVAKKLLKYSETGEVFTEKLAMPRIALNDYYSGIAYKYLNEASPFQKRNKHFSWPAKRFFSWLADRGINDIGKITYVEIRQFIIDMISVLSPQTMPNLRGGLRKFFKWAYDNDYTTDTFEGLFEFTVAITRKIQPPPLPDEVSLVLDSIDRNTILGKRNYAIIMLGVVTGLRAGDVANLKLSDVDWKNGEIRVTQRKTGKPLALPLTKDVGDSLRDYILNARPESKSENVFLRAIAPYQGFQSGSAVGGIYESYRGRLGLPAGGFHSLRRALGKNLVMSGTPVTTVAQVLGHVNIENTSQYISLDTLHLKECALDLTGIEPVGWAK
jgi:integrase